MRRKLIIGSVGIALCLGALATYLLFHLDPIIEGLRPQLLGLLSKTVGQEVSAGEIKAKLLPQATFEIRDLTTGSGNNGATVRSVRLFTSLLDLLGGSPSISDIVVDDVNLAFTRSKDGTLSVGGIKLGAKKPAKNGTATAHASPEKSAQPANGKQSPNNESAAPPLDLEARKANTKDQEVAFQIKNFTVTNANVSLVDETVSPSPKITLTKINAYLKEVQAAGTAKVDLSGNLFGADQPNLQLTGIAGNPLVNQPLELKFALKPLDLTALAALATTYGAQAEGTTFTGPLDLILSFKTRQGTPGVDATLLLNGKNIALDHNVLFHKEQGTNLDFSLDLSGTLDRKLIITAKKCSLRLGANEIEFPWTIDSGNPLIDLDAPEIFSGEIHSKGIDLTELSKSIPLLVPYSLGGVIVPDLRFRSETQSSAYPSDATKAAGNESKASSSSPDLTGTVRLSQVSAKINPPAPNATPGKEPAAAPTPAIELANLEGAINFNPNDISAKGLSGFISKQPFQLDFKAAPSQEAGLKQPTVAAVITSDRFDLLPFLAPAQAASLKALSFNKLTLLSNYSVSNQSGSLSLSAESANLTGVTSGALKLKLDITPDKFILAPSTLAVFGGSVTLGATVGKLPASAFNSNITASQLNLQQLTQALSSQSKVGISGTLASFRTDLSGKRENLVGSLTGPLSLEAINGEITGFNLVRETLSKVDTIPGIQGALTGLIPEKFRDITAGEGTAFDQITADGAFASGRLNLNSVKLAHKLYSVTGKGWLVPGGDMEIKIQLQLVGALTSEMIAKQKALKLLVDKAGSLVIPVVVTRHDGKMLVLPDVSDLTKRGLRGAAKDAAGKALEKVSPGLGEASKILDGLF